MKKKIKLSQKKKEKTLVMIRLKTLSDVGVLLEEALPDVRSVRRSV